MVQKVKEKQLKATAESCDADVMIIVVIVVIVLALLHQLIILLQKTHTNY